MPTVNKPKNLVICCDGTNNEVAGDPTNVLRLYRMLQRCDEQIAFYDSGVGTIPSAEPITSFGRSVTGKLDSAMGLTIRQHFLNAYRFLIRHYQPGDQIFLFGFSRGAYTARAVAGAVHLFGILRPELEDLSELVWSTYSGESPESKEGGVFRGAATVKKSFSVQGLPDPRHPTKLHTPIHCMGVWDTVSAFGAIWDLRSLPHSDRNPSLRHVRHAMATDEHRAMFRVLPFLPVSDDDHESIKQVWFAGVHSDVGGGYPDAIGKKPAQSREGALSKVSMEWMLKEVLPLGLKIDPTQRTHLLNNPPDHPPADAFGMQHESLTCGWAIPELLPQRRFSKKDNPEDRGGLAWFFPNFWRRRKMEPIPSSSMTTPGTIVPSIRVHQSVVDRQGKGSVDGPYRPSNLPPLNQCEIEPY